MICPHCKDTLILRSPAWHNVEAYGKSVKVFTMCCQKPIRLARVVRFDATPTTIEGEDDWGYTKCDAREY